MKGTLVRRRWFAAGIALVLGQTAGLWSAEPDAEGNKLFQESVRPLLVDHCYRCHSAQAEQVEADLYVDSREGLLRGGDQGPAIEPGNPAGSLLLQAVLYEIEDLKMPPDKRLEDRQIADLRKWIKLGAPYPVPAKKQATR